MSAIPLGQVCVDGWVGGGEGNKGEGGRRGRRETEEDRRGGVGGVEQRVHNELNRYISSLSQNNFIVVNIIIIVSKGWDIKYYIVWHLRSSPVRPLWFLAFSYVSLPSWSGPQHWQSRVSSSHALEMSGMMSTRSSR